MNNISFSGFLCIDISKDKFDAYCTDIYGEKQFYLSCSRTERGLREIGGPHG